MSEIDLTRLSEPFEPSEIEWRVGAVNKDKLIGIALPYITNRAVQNRLDEVCGVGNWWNEFKQWGENSQLCGITIFLEGRPVTKWDGADNTKVDPTKGGLSNSMKRAAAQWGIGRYLYDLPTFWMNVRQVGSSYKLDGEFPQLPKEALPKNFKGKQNFAEGDMINDNARTLDDALNEVEGSDRLSETKAQMLETLLRKYEERGGLSVKKILGFYKVSSTKELTNQQYSDICRRCLDDGSEKKKKSTKK